MLLLSETLSSLWDLNSLLSLLNAACKEAANINFSSLWFESTGDQTHNLPYSMQDWGSNPQSTVLNARLGIKPTIYRTQCKIGDQTHNLPYSMQDWGSNTQSTVLNASILTIIPSMQFALLTEIYSMKTILNKKDQWMFIINLTTSYTEVKLIYPRK